MCQSAELSGLHLLPASQWSKSVVCLSSAELCSIVHLHVQIPHIAMSTTAAVVRLVQLLPSLEHSLQQVSRKW